MENLKSSIKTLNIGDSRSLEKRGGVLKKILNKLVDIIDSKDEEDQNTPIVIKYKYDEESGNYINDNDAITIVENFTKRPIWIQEPDEYLQEEDVTLTQFSLVVSVNTRSVDVEDSRIFVIRENKINKVEIVH